MIHVDRSRVPAPAALTSSTADSERKKAQDHFGPGASARQKVQKYQERFEWNWPLLHDARQALNELFHSKCAFCESPDKSTNPLNVGHFRPITEIVDPKSPSTAGYWWLAYEWDNIYLICKACSDRSKLRFPIEGRRAPPGTRWFELGNERPLLLDPCADHPEQHLTFLDSTAPEVTIGSAVGIVRPRARTRLGKEARGDAGLRARTTIELFSLNRSELVQQRQSAMDEFRRGWLIHRMSHSGRAAAGKFDLSKSPNWLVKHLGPSSPYLGCIEELKGRLESDFELVPVPHKPLREKRAAKSRPSPAPTVQTPSAHGWYLRRVEILNYKAIGRLSLDIPRGGENKKGWQTGWKVLLGENGTGKSTVLQAIVMAFLGERSPVLGRIAPKSLLRREGAGKTASRGFVKLYWVDRVAPTIMRFSRSGFRIEGELPPRQLVLRAYGATRHLPSGRHRASAKAKLQDVRNLFNPFMPVCDANGWLVGLKGPKGFGSAALSLKDLLDLTPRTRLDRKGGKVRVRIGGVDVTLDELSAGFQSVVVLATDIMAGVHGQAHDLRFASGVVLIDELDAHLHPRWKMRIVGSLRRTFPGLQFIVTTHEPLCLRGLKAGEIAVMRREGGTVEVVADVPSPEGLRIDQLLTSPLFGLHSTVDPDVDRDFQRYYQLLGKPSLDENEDRERQGLRDDLTKAGILGNPVVGHNRRDQLVYEAVDQYIAKEPLLSVDDRTKFKEETKQKVHQIWADVLSQVAVP